MVIKHIKTDIRPRTDSIIQFNFLKGMYYNTKGQYDDNLIHNTHILLRFFDNDDIERKIDEFTSMSQHLQNLLGKRNASDSGRIYLEMRNKIELDNEIRQISSALSRLRGQIIRFNVHAMEELKIMEKPITRMQLEKLPLILKGGHHSESFIDDDFDIEF